MDWIKSEWLKLTLGLIYAVLTASLLMAMGSIADKINSKADKREVKQQIELIKKDIVPLKQITIKMKSEILAHEEKDIIRYQSINMMFKTIIENQDKILNKHDARLTRLENK